MEIGTEISQKIRSAIKAKLIELGAYVDDELPDYIMVMVANKKTQKQMTDDLSLFLNTNTEKFTSWLHSLLKKLQAINTDSPPGKHKHKEKDRQKGEKRKHKSSHSEKTHKSTDAAKQPKTSVTENKAGTKKKETENKEKEKKEENKEEPVTSATKPVSPTPPAAEDVAVDEINIIENTDEFNEENKEIEKTQSKKASKPPGDVGKTENGAEVKKPSAKVSTREEKVSSKSRSASSSSQKSKDEGKAVRKKPISFVASVKRKYVEEEEEYDPLNPAVGSVASVVRGPTRKSSVPKSLQANKSLLMRAVSDAEKSVTTSKKTDLPSPSEPLKPAMRSDRKPVDLSRRLKTAAGLQLISRSKRKEMLQELKYTVDNDPPQEPVKKQRRSTESLENMKYTVKNEVKSPAKKTSPKTKSLAVAPSRVAATALRGLDQQSRVNSKKVEEVQQAPDTPDEEQEEKSVDEERSPATSDDELDGDSVDEISDENDDESEGEEMSDESEEIEIEITDRAAQTIVNMRNKNFRLLDTEDKPVSTERHSQTDVKETGYSENSEYKLTKEKLKDIDASLLNLFIENTLPFDFVVNESFKMFTKTLEPKYHFPKKKKLITEIGMLYNTVKDNLKSDLAPVHSLALTHNTWSSINGDMYDSAAVHFVTDDWKLKSAVLRTTCLAQDHVYESIVEHLKESRVKWGLPEPIAVTESTDVEDRVFDMLDWKKVLCFGCCIQKMVKGCLNDPDVGEFIEKGRNLLQAIQKSDLASDMFEQKKKLLLPKHSQAQKLSVDDKSKWSSTLDMIARLSEQTPPLHAAVMDTELINQGVDLRNQLFSFNEQSILESLVKIISHFKTAAEILTNNENPTIQKVIPIFVKLEKALEEDADDSPMIGKLKQAVMEQIDSFLQEGRDICLLACLVHPQTKQMAFVSQEDKDHVKSLLFNELEVQYEEENRESGDHTTFKKGKKANQSRQTKAMSKLSDLRYVVMNEDNNEGTNNEKDSCFNLHDKTDLKNNASDERKTTERSVTSNEEKISHSIKCASTSGSPDKSRPREVESSDELGDLDSSSIKQPTLSITVENDWLDDVICAGVESKTPGEMAKVELDLYVAESASSKNPLSWWKEKHVLYPCISKVARKILAIPASSISANDVFCMDSKLADYKVAQIKPEHVDMMVFLKKNKTLYD